MPRPCLRTRRPFCPTLLSFSSCPLWSHLLPFVPYFLLSSSIFRSSPPLSVFFPAYVPGCLSFRTIQVRVSPRCRPKLPSSCLGPPVQEVGSIPSHRGGSCTPLDLRRFPSPQLCTHCSWLLVLHKIGERFLFTCRARPSNVLAPRAVILRLIP